VSETFPVINGLDNMNRERFFDIVTVFVAICAIVSMSLVVYRELSIQTLATRTSAVPIATLQSDWENYVEGRHVGRADGPVTIVAFADFQCSKCRSLHNYLDSLRSSGIGVRLIYRHYPLPEHPYAIAAVRAAECAADQSRYDAMHSALFGHMNLIGMAPWSWFARFAGVRDSARFVSCVEASSPLEVLARDTMAARRLLITTLPTLLIERFRFDGLPPFDTIKHYIDRVSADRNGGGPSAGDIGRSRENRVREPRSLIHPGYRRFLLETVRRVQLTRHG
jgi:protein-disulfide isomerase